MNPVEKVSTSDIQAVLNKTFLWSKNQGMKGDNKHDALNSPVLSTLFGWHKWLRIIAIQGVMRFPVNLRSFLFVPKVYNPKGLSLFVIAYLDLFQESGDKKYLEEAKSLLQLLSGIRSTGRWSGDCWGYAYPWQDPGFYAPAHMPNAVVSCFVAESFLRAYDVTGDTNYLDSVGSTLQFLFNDLPVLKKTNDELCLGYMPMPMSMRVMDVSILIASIAIQYATITNNEELKKTGERLLCYVLNQQTEYGAWFYTDPPEGSLIRHDNYHTGFILDAFWKCMNTTSDWSMENKYYKGLDFYAKELFNPDGSPRWMSDKDFPHDIHGAAQGIITFSRHSDIYPGLAEKIATWAITHMYNSQGRFFYQQTRWYRKRFTLLRWCNAWMVRALSVLLLERKTANEKN
ncbi:MAG: hypothetical protein ACC651_03955 [Candidatus Scalindua sp.]